MGRTLAVGYGANAVPLGTHHPRVEADIQVPQYVNGRNVQEVVSCALDAKPELCSATKKNGEPCQGRPLESLTVCVFHREAG